MPSCVVKCCKNSSVVQNKSTGISFHKFPRDFIQKQEWINIIRTCIMRNCWTPSKFSVKLCGQYTGKGISQKMPAPNTSNPEAQMQSTVIEKEPYDPEYYWGKNSNEVKSSVPQERTEPFTDQVVQSECLLKIANEFKSTVVVKVGTQDSDIFENEELFEHNPTSMEAFKMKMEPKSPSTFDSRAEEQTTNQCQKSPRNPIQYYNRFENEEPFQHEPTSIEESEVKMEPESPSTSSMSDDVEDQSIDSSDECQENPRSLNPTVQDLKLIAICNSPLEFKLRNKLKKQIQLSEIRKKKMKMLYQKIRTLQAANKKLKETVKKLKKERS
ncbi:uncharacterized protein LOC113491866 isoform X2 [Trichoplusia ni]|uniref:Uncharacterized protein LOC113491866 isoform X2 n=1 Tax=Trichoplusia ni TaxID=7111 RepID=A0A7E5V985_TRINI|nr:uncharacterized protein LOC113491866 isoform X2 [Trichoplusia ni]